MKVEPDATYTSRDDMKVETKHAPTVRGSLLEAVGLSTEALGAC